VKTTVSYEEWEANQRDEPEPGECYCHLLRGQQLCQVCTQDLVRVTPQEVYGLPTPQQPNPAGLRQAQIELSPLEVELLCEFFTQQERQMTIQ